MLEIFLLLLLNLFLPIMWLVAELKNYSSKKRIVRGILSLCLTISTCGFFSAAQRLEYMVNYPMVTSNLIYNTLVQLDKGNETGVFGALKKLNSELTSHKGTPIEIYRKIVKDAVTSMEK